jgi:hypothetical protein
MCWKRQTPQFVLQRIHRTLPALAAVVAGGGAGTGAVGSGLVFGTGTIATVDGSAAGLTIVVVAVVAVVAVVVVAAAIAAAVAAAARVTVVGGVMVLVVVDFFEMIVVDHPFHHIGQDVIATAASTRDTGKLPCMVVRFRSFVRGGMDPQSSRRTTSRGSCVYYQCPMCVHIEGVVQHLPSVAKPQFREYCDKLVNVGPFQGHAGATCKERHQRGIAWH